jgi:flagellar export protein FliJ
VTANRFTFRLQRLLALRQMAERAAAIALGTAQAVAAEAHAAEESLARRRASAREAMLPHPGTERRVADLRQVAFLVEQIDARALNAGKTAKVADRNVQDTRERLGARVQERRILERLRERHLVEWSRGTERLEREMMDGIARPAAGAGTNTLTDD